MKDRTRKICSVLLTLALAVGILLPMGAETVEAADNTIIRPNEFNYDENGDGTITITAFPQKAYQENGTVVVPDTIDGYTVTAIDNNVSYADEVVDLTIPGTVTEIQSHTFDRTSSLQSLKLENGVEKIGAYAFDTDTGLSSVQLSNTLSEIGQSAFGTCSSLKDIDLPDSLTRIGSQAFEQSGLTSLTLPDSVRSVGRQAFLECRSLVSAKLSSGMTTIPSQMFQRCTSLRTVTIPASITSIANTAFDGCDLTTIYYGGTQAQWEALLEQVKSVSTQTYEMMMDANVTVSGGGDPSTPTEPDDPSSAIPTPVNVTAESTVDGVQLEWNIPLSVGDTKWDYDGVIVCRENTNGSYTNIGRTTQQMDQTYLDKDVEDGKTYTYALCAYKGNEWGEHFSNSVTITYDANPFTTTTIRDTAILLGNQQDGEDNYIGVDKLWLTTGAQGMRIDLIFPEEMDELKNETLSVTVSGGGQTFQGTAVEYIGQQVSFTLVLTGGKHLKPNTTYTVTVKDARGNTIAATTLESAGRETSSWGFTNKDASYSLTDLKRYYPESIAEALYDLDKSHGEDGLCFGMALAGALWQQGDMPRISSIHELLNTTSWGTTLVSGQWQGVSLEDYIKACNALQFSQPYAKQTRNNRDDYDGLVRAVKSGEPVIIGTWINGMEGHAVLAYDYKEDSSSFTIYVQDPQCMPYQISTLTLKGRSGAWYGWSYERRGWKVDSSGAEDPNMYFAWRSATTTPDDDFSVDSVFADAKENIKYNIGNDLDNLWNGLVGGAGARVTPIAGTSGAWLEGSGTVTMNSLSDEVSLADSEISVTARGTNARFALADGIDSATVSGSGNLALNCTAGDVTVTFNGTAANGVTLARSGDSVTISGASGGSVVVSENGATTTTTTITPGQDVSVTLDGDINEEPDTPAGDMPFTDVRTSDWFYDPVKYVYEEGLMTGTGATAFAPNVTTTRAMIVSILYRLEGGPAVSGNSSPFNDVHTSDWYYDAVRWAERTGVVGGVGDGRFAPNTAITREQLAAMLMNYANYKHQNVSARADLSRYSDADRVSAWAEDAVAWANAEGYISGMTATTLAPQGSATRAQVAAILQRYLAD